MTRLIWPFRISQRTYGKLSDYRDIAPLLGNEDAEAGELIVVADRDRSCGDTHVLLVTRESIEALHALNPKEGIAQSDALLALVTQLSQSCWDVDRNPFGRQEEGAGPQQISHSRGKGVRGAELRRDRGR